MGRDAWAEADFRTGIGDEHDPAVVAEPAPGERIARAGPSRGG